MNGCELVINSRLLEDQVKGCDVVFFNRIISSTSLNRVLELKEKYGFKMICDMDDHWYLGPDHYLYKSYQSLNISELIEAYIKESDHVFVTHERLFHDVFPINQNVHILPNAIPRFGQFDIEKTESEFIRLFWAGGVTHRRDIEVLSGPVRRFNFPVQMVMGGYSENPEYKAMAAAYTNGGRLRNNLINALPVDEYYKAYQECDIALIPLKETKFNSYKSNLKILEAANIGAPCIVSKVHPYLDFPEDLINYVENQSDWYRQVKRLIKGWGDQGERLREYCNEHFNFFKINDQRKQIIEYVTGKHFETGKVTAQVRLMDDGQGACLERVGG